MLPDAWNSGLHDGAPAPRATTASTANAAMNRYCGGEDDAFGDVYAKLAPRLLAFVRRRTRDDASAEDIMQQVFVRMHLARGRFVVGSDVTTWSFAIARNVLIDRFRHSRRQLSVVSEDSCGPLAHHDDPERMVQRSELAVRMQDELSRMKPLHRQAFELVQYQGHSIASAASATATTTDAIKKRAHRAYSALRATFDAHD